MGDIAGVENDLTTIFTEETEQHKEQLIKNWSIECMSWLNRARAYLHYQEKEYNNLIQLAQKANESYQNFSNLLKKKRQAKALITNTKILEDGYILLNKIGEKIRGEEILYSVTVTQTGSGIASGNAGGVITVQVNLQTFLQNYVNFSHTRITLRDSAALYKMIEAQIQNNELKSDQYEKWTEEKIVNFSLYDSQIRAAKNQHFENINAGNMLEGFLRFLDGGMSISKESSSNYWGPLIRSMKSTLASPDPFWKGPDLADKQIKGLNASVTNLSSLIRTISDTFNILKSNKIGAEAIRSAVVKKQIPTIDEMANQTIDQISKKLEELFTSSIKDRNNINFTLDFS